MSRIAFFTTTLLALLLAAALETPAIADTATSEQPRLPAMVRAAGDRFRPFTSRDLEASRSALRQAVAALDYRLDREAANGRDWREYLELRTLEEQLPHAAKPDPETLRRLHSRFVGGSAGLETRVFIDVRAALAAFIQVVEDSADGSLRQDFEAHVDALADALQASIDRPDEANRRQIAQHLGWLERHRQVEWLVAAVRQANSRPNLRFCVSEKAIAALASASIDETSPVREVVLDSTVRGTGRTVGTITASVLPDEDRGMLELEMVATNRSRTVGYNGPVRVYQDNQTELHGRKRVILDSQGLRSLPAESTASAESRVTGIKTNFRSDALDAFVRSVACRRIREQSDLAEQIVETRQQCRLNQRLDRDLDAKLAEGNTQLAEKLFGPLHGYDVFPRRFDVKSRSGQLLIDVEQATSSQLGAPDEPPPLLAQSDLAFQMHFSSVENLAAGLLAGETLSATRIDQLIQEITGARADDEKQTAADDVAIRLADDRPLVLEIDDGAVALTVRGRRYIARNQSYPAMDVSIRYQLQAAQGGLRATLLGEPEIVPPRFAEEGSNRLSAREAALRRLLLNRLNRDLRKEIFSDGITLTGSASVLGKLRVVQLVADDGWLTLACKQP